MDSSARSQKARLDYDVVVVGGCYSAPATAMLLARAGIRVGLVDRPVGEIDALLAHALLRAGVIQRHRWGLLDQVIAAAITAHGISDALRDAELLAVATTAFLGGELTEAAAMAEYHRTRDRLSRRLFEVSDIIASYRWDTRSVEAHLRCLSAAMVDEVDYLLACGSGAPSRPAGDRGASAHVREALTSRVYGRSEGQR